MGMDWKRSLVKILATLLRAGGGAEVDPAQDGVVGVGRRDPDRLDG